MPRDHSKSFKFETTNGNPGWKDQVERTKAKCEEQDPPVDSAELDELLAELPPESSGRKWTATQIATVVRALVACCPGVAVESLGGTGVEGEAILDEEFRSDTVYEPGQYGDGIRLRWKRRIYDKIDEAIEFQCGCCWTITADVNVTFLGNLTPNPQTIFLTTPADCEVTEEELAEMLSTALLNWLTEKMDVISNLEGFDIQPTGQVSLSQGASGPNCVYNFHGPIIES